MDSNQFKKPPLVTVVIPVFNRARSLATALRSVIGQTFADWEAIVVDDGSSDGSANVVLQMGQPGKIRVIRHEGNQGSAQARNSGILAARGRYVSFLDSDDSWHPEKLARQVELVEAAANPEMIFCVTQTLAFRDAERFRVVPDRGPRPDEPWSEFLFMNGGFAQTNSYFLSRDLAMRVGFKSPHDDHFFFVKAGALGARYQLVAEPLSKWNDDSRSDRISQSANLECSREFLDHAGEFMTERAKLAFEVRELGPLLLKRNPLQAMRLFRRALKEGAVLRRHILAVCTRCALPAPAVALLRRVYYSSASSQSVPISKN